MKNGLYNKFGLWTKVCVVIFLFCGMGWFGNVNVAGAADTEKTGVTESVPESASYLKEAGFQSLSAMDPDFDKLAQAVQEIESRTSLRAHKVEGTKTLPKVVVSGDVKLVEFSDTQRFGETTFLLYGDGGKTFFLRLRSSANDPEVRLWSEGPSEIIMSNQGTRWQSEPSSDTFRFEYATGSGIENLTGTDSLVCLAKLLGLSSVDWTSAFSVISNLVCNGDDAAKKAAQLAYSAVQTLLHCFSMASVGVANVTSTFGCVSGLAKMIFCTWLTCAITPMNLGEAVDNTALTWTTGGTSGWFGQSSIFMNGGDAAQSGVISHNQSSYIQTTVTGPKTLKFYWKVSSEGGYDFLKFFIDGVEQSGSISGGVDWRQKTYQLSSGSRILKWVYSKDGSVNSGSDAGWLDKVEIN